VLTPGEARRLLRAPDVATAAGVRDQALLEMFYATGLRLAEMAALAVHDVDWREGFVRVRRGKGGKERIVPMGATASAALRRYLHDVRAKWIARAAQPGDALWLASCRPHQPMKSQALYSRVKELSKQAGLRITPHVWRHSCATHLVSNGANLFAVQRQLGHRSLATTQLYTRVSVPDLKRTWRAKHPRRRAKLP
jgi:integrase/recombinase XerD